ncbi:MAG: EVE domain-containing protein [Gemmatimonadetes bacterium]|nr:EVE domain-containing protein [Gemmatimonadota bacterium]MCC7132730.1 EVE domain-containing protein [Gemmatimonadales bacterium]
MPNRWLLKTEPSTYSYDHLERDKRSVWDGVSNPVALKHLRSMAAGDECLIYHTGDEKRVVGIAKVVSAAYPDPKQKDPRLVVVDLAPGRRLTRPVTLAEIKADDQFAGWELVRVPRLSVMPVPDAHWKRILDWS